MARKKSDQPTPRTELAGLLDAARDAPDDDGPRLVLADWLEEQSGEDDRRRGAFVRDQVVLDQQERADPRVQAARGLVTVYPHLASLDTTLAYVRQALLAERPDLKELADHIEQTRTQHGYDWAGPLKEFSYLFTFRRGLIGLRGPANEFPWRAMGAVASTECACWVDGLTLYDASAKDAPRIGRCPLLAGVRELCLERNRLDGAGLAAMLASPHLARLAALDLSRGDALGARGADELAKAELPALRQLRLEQVTVRGSAFLQNASWLGQLETLDLLFSGVTAEAVEPALAGGKLSRLRRLNLGNNTLGTALVPTLRTLPNPGGLSVLGLYCNRVGPDGLRALLDWPGLSGLEILDLGVNEFGQAEAEAIAACPALSALRYLSLGGNPVGDGGLRALARSPHLRGLGGLSIWGTSLTKASAKVLNDLDNFPLLGWVSAGSNKMDETLLHGRFPPRFAAKK
jgi:uncharacterized protein (TIGR02996 family)